MENKLYHRLCKVCNAQNAYGNLLRSQVDELISKGKTNRECIQFLSQNGISTAERNFSRHLNNHSEFVRQIRSDEKAIKLMQQYAQKKKQAQPIAQEIINKGSVMIDNWWNKVKGQPQIPITGKMVMEALKLLEGKVSKTKWSDRFE